MLQRKIRSNWYISSSIFHYIKSFKKSWGVIVLKGWRRRSKLDTFDLQFLRQHCIKNRHSSIPDIATYERDYGEKTLSSSNVRCQLKLYSAKRKPCFNHVQRQWLWGLYSIFNKDCIFLDLKAGFQHPVWHSFGWRNFDMVTLQQSENE